MWLSLDVSRSDLGVREVAISAGVESSSRDHGGCYLCLSSDLFKVLVRLLYLAVWRFTLHIMEVAISLCVEIRPRYQEGGCLCLSRDLFHGLQR